MFRYNEEMFQTFLWLLHDHFAACLYEMITVFSNLAAMFIQFCSLDLAPGCVLFFVLVCGTRIFFRHLHHPVFLSCSAFRQSAGVCLVSANSLSTELSCLLSY